MTEENKTTDLIKEDAKTLKRLLDAHMLVAQNKLGRSPTMQELLESIGEQQPAEKKEEVPVPEAVENEQAAKEPKILHFKVYYGMSDKKNKDGALEKCADPNKILYYESGDGTVYDVGTQQWMPDRPSILDHLPVRPLMHDERGQDVLRAIANGVLDDDDYDALEKVGMINEDAKKVFGLYKKALDLNTQMQQLEKSEEPEEPVEKDESSARFITEEELKTNFGESPETKSGEDLVASIMSSAGVQSCVQKAKEELGEPGANLIVEILRAAMADVDEKTKMLVQQEIEAYIAPLAEAVEIIAQHLNLQQPVEQVEEDLTEPVTQGMIES